MIWWSLKRVISYSYKLPQAAFRMMAELAAVTSIKREDYFSSSLQLLSFVLEGLSIYAISLALETFFK